MQQNWIGGGSYNPCGAAFVPPPPEHVQLLLEDLCAFCNADPLPAVAQAALAHAQFETIHPFIDGNGRTGRALIHMVLRRRGLALTILPPISPVLATWSSDYIDALMGTRYRGRSTSAAAYDGLDRWIALFAAATQRAVADAELYEQRVDDLKASWRKRLGRVRAGSAVDLLIEALPGAPVLTVQSAPSLLGRSAQAVNEAVPRLIEAGILRQTTVGRRNRAFEAPELIDAFTDLERRLASPQRDTRISPPIRPLPRHRSSSAESSFRGLTGSGLPMVSSRGSRRRLFVKHSNERPEQADFRRSRPTSRTRQTWLVLGVERHLLPGCRRPATRPRSLAPPSAPAPG